jgi:YHS domain-containing protein
MKSKLIITMSALALIMSQGMLFAQEGHEHGDHKDSMMMDHDAMMGDQGMMDQQMGEETTKAVEVGNKICPVSGDKIPASGETGAMGEVVKYEYKGKIYNLCCEMCIKDFKKDPEKYSQMAEQEAAQNKEGEAGHSEGSEGDHEHQASEHHHDHQHY